MNPTRRCDSRPGAFAVLPALAVTLLMGSARADTLTLKTGDAFECEVLLEKPDKLWVRTFTGARWVNRADLSGWEKGPSPWQRYADAKKRFKMTAAAQFELAMWCGDNNLPEEKDRHLKAALNLDPKFDPAYVALGYVKEGVPGVEKTGPTPREEDAERRARATWSYKVSEINERYLAGGLELKREGARRILAIGDPLAADAIIEVLAAHKEAPHRLLCARALKNLKSDRSTLQLLVMALSDSDNQVADEARKSLVVHADPRVPVMLRDGLAGTAEMLDRCAEALGMLGDLDSVPNLINVLSVPDRLGADEDPDTVAEFWRIALKHFGRANLVFESKGLMTHHEIQGQLHGRIGPQGKHPKNPNAPVQIRYQTAVLEALVRISRSEKNLGFDRAAWTNWWKVKSAALKKEKEKAKE